MQFLSYHMTLTNVHATHINIVGFYWINLYPCTR